MQINRVNLQSFRLLSSVKKRTTAVFSALAMFALFGCSGGSGNGTETLLPPFVGIDFPSTVDPFGTTVRGTDGNQITLYGVTQGLTSEVQRLEFAVLGADSDDEPVPVNTQQTPQFNWSQSFDLETDEDVNALIVTAFDSNRSRVASALLAVGSSWMLERGLLFDSVKNRWLVVDASRKQVLDLDLLSGVKTPLAGVPALALGMPEDMAFDPPFPSMPPHVVNRAIIADSQLAALMAVDLSLGSDLDGSLSELSGPIEGIGLPLEKPVAIEINRTIDATNAYVLDASSKAVIKVDLDSGDRELLVDQITTSTGMISFDEPVDLVLQSASRLFVADAGLNAIILVNPSDGSASIFSDNSTPENQAAQFNGVNGLALVGDRLFATVGLLRAIFEIDTRADDNNVDPPIVAGARTYFSAVFAQRPLLDSNGELQFSTNGDGALVVEVFSQPDVANPLVFPTAMAFDSSKDSLLVIDNLLGNIVEIETRPSSDVPLIVSGARDYVAGGASVAASENEIARSTGRATTNLAFVGAISPQLRLVGNNVPRIYFIDTDNNELTFVRLRTESNFTPVGTVSLLSDNSQQDPPIELLDPLLLESDASAGFYVVDVGLDQVIEIDSVGTRSVASDVGAVVFSEPVASVLYEELSVETDPNITPTVLHKELYVLDKGLNDIVKIDFLNSGARSLLTQPTTNVNLNNPVAMVLNPARDQLLVVGGTTCGLIEVTIFGGSVGDRMSWPCLSPNPDDKTENVVDVIVDLRDESIESDDRLLVLDASRSAIFPISLGDGDFGSDGDDIVNRTTPNSANVFVSAKAMLLDSVRQRLYVLDDVINSLYEIDIRARETVVDPQRLVLIRGTALNRE